MTTTATAVHRIQVESNTADGFLLVCSEESCRRRVVLHRAGGMTVIDRGDFFASHIGGNDGLEMNVT